MPLWVGQGGMLWFASLQGELKAQILTESRDQYS